MPPTTLRIGFTGTREGMTDAQRAKLMELLATGEGEWIESGKAYQIEFHHGCCVGADEQAVKIAKATLTAKIVAHPANIGMTSIEAQADSDEIRYELPPLTRNQNIVSETSWLISTPKGFSEERRSGTWATVRMARRAERLVTIIWPDGEMTVEEPE